VFYREGVKLAPPLHVNNTPGRLPTIGLMLILLLSVAPEVIMISLGSAPMRLAICCGDKNINYDSMRTYNT